jgi:hypothetical protein
MMHFFAGSIVLLSAAKLLSEGSWWPGAVLGLCGVFLIVSVFAQPTP